MGDGTGWHIEHAIYNYQHYKNYNYEINFFILQTVPLRKKIEINLIVDPLASLKSLSYF